MVEKLIFRAAAHNVELVVLHSSVSLQLRKGFHIALRKAAVGTAKIVADADELPAGRPIKGGFHALGSQKFRGDGIDKGIAGAFLEAFTISAKPSPLQSSFCSSFTSHMPMMFFW